MYNLLRSSPGSSMNGKILRFGSGFVDLLDFAFYQL